MSGDILPKINFELLSTRKIENIVDKGLRHKSGLVPRDYLKHWLYIARHFGYATQDDSWGEFEKEFAIIIKRLVVAEREREAFKTTNDAKRIERLKSALTQHVISNYGDWTECHHCMREWKTTDGPHHAPDCPLSE